MSKPTEQETFRIAAKKRLVERNMTVSKLAVDLGFARNTVSMAINHTVFPTVRRKIAKALQLEVAA